MASKFLVPLHLVKLSTTPSNPGTGFLKVYIKGQYLTYLAEDGAETDVVLARPMTGFSNTANAASVVSTDTLLQAINKLQAGFRTFELTGDVTGTGTYSANKFTVATTIAPDSVALGTDTTGNYVASISAASGEGITVNNGTGEGSTPTVALKNAANFTDKYLPRWDDANGQFINSFISETAGGGTRIEGQGVNIDGVLTVGTNLTVTGNLTVNGTTTTVNSETVTIADNIIQLNSNVSTGAPTENAGIEIRRGSSASVQLRWNETTDKWQITEDGTTFHDIVTSASAPNVTAGPGISVTSSGNTVTVSHADTSSAASTANAGGGTSVIQNVTLDTYGHVTAVSTVALKYTTTVGDGTATSYTVTHNKGEAAVMVQVYETPITQVGGAITPGSYAQVECDVVIVDEDSVTLSFAIAPSNNQYTVVII